MKKLFKYFFYTLLFSLFIIFLYTFLSYLFSVFPKQSNTSSKKDETIYLIYNEMHSDIVFNINDINRSLFLELKEQEGYLAFGWGDKETYLNTPTWNDLSIVTSIKALFINTPSLMHISYIPNINLYTNVKTIKLSKEEKLTLQQSILKSFNFRGKQYRGYGEKDFFYTAYGNYNLINTCNTWTGDQLRNVDVNMSYWTPFSWSVTAALP